MTTQRTVRALQDLGFTQVEAEVYAYLVGHSPATGYQIAKAIDRTRGATYSVLSSLAAKGAVMVEVGATQLWRAVPATEFLDVLERRFARGKREAEAALRHVEPSSQDSLVYQLRTPEQVYERARKMLSCCTKIALLDLDPEPFELLRKDIEAAVKRGIKTALLGCDPVRLRGARTVTYFPGYKIKERSLADQLVVAIDGREFLISSLSIGGDRVMQACWSASPFLAWVVSTYLKTTISGEEFVTLIEGGASLNELKAHYRSFYRFLPPFSSPGYADLMKQFKMRLT